MAGAATIQALVNRPHAEPEIRGSRARSGSRGSRQDHDGPGLVSDRLYRPRRLEWQLRAGETRPVSNAGSLRGSTQGRCRRGRLSGGVPGGDEKRTRNCAMNCVMRTRLIGHLCVLSLQDDWGPICGGSGRRYRQRVSQIPSTQPRRNCLRERTSIGALERPRCSAAGGTRFSRRRASRGPPWSPTRC